MSANSAPHFVAQVQMPDACTEPAYWFLFQGDKHVVLTGGETLQIPCVIDPSEVGLTTLRRQYLGYIDQDGRHIHCYSAEVDPTVTLDSRYAADSLRQFYAQLGDFWFQLAGRAIQIVDWDRTHQFCGRCGGRMESAISERAKRCSICGLSNFPRLSPAIIIAVTRQIDGVNHLLLARNHRFPTGRYSILAGFVEPGESLEECAGREVMEEVGIQIDNIRYVASQPWPFPNSLMLGFTAAYAGGDLMLEDAEIAEAGWFRADNLPGLPPKPSIARRLIDAFVAVNHPDLVQGDSPAQLR
jgi:NAD+ diphosphatase